MHYVEGPARYTPQDVADAFSEALNREVTVEVASRSTWQALFKSAGSSPEAASAYARMTAVSLDSIFDKPAWPIRGTTDLKSFIRAAIGSKE